jgi:hypothetical protein
LVLRHEDVADLVQNEKAIKETFLAINAGGIGSLGSARASRL